MRASPFTLVMTFAACIVGVGCSSCLPDADEVRAPTAPVAATNEVPEVAEADLRDRVELVAVTGQVESRMPGGEWKTLSPGERLHEDESIRTVGGGTAILKLGDTAQVELSPSSEFSVPEISESLARVKLSEGRVAAVVNGSGGSTLRVEVLGNDAVAETTGGEFAVLTNGGGAMAVAATDGKVKLSSSRGTVEVAAGQQTMVEPNQAPAPPTAIPSSLYLKVGKPASLLQRERQTTIGGRATPGAVVSINGVRVVTDAEGAFRATVPLTDGENALTVRALDVVGRSEKVELPTVVVKDAIGSVRTKVRWTEGSTE